MCILFQHMLYISYCCCSNVFNNISVILYVHMLKWNASLGTRRYEDPYIFEKIKAGDLDVLIRWGVANHKNLIPTLFPFGAVGDFAQGILISPAVEKTVSLWGFSYANTLGFQVLRNMHIFSLLEFQEKYLINKFKFNVKLDIQSNFENNF